MTKLVEEIHRLNAVEKLELLGLIWDDLASTPDLVPSPAWHEKELRRREERINTGEATFSDWEEARERISKKIS
jgi:putative addiction module component (TIGR02574 family)